MTAAPAGAARLLTRPGCGLCFALWRLAARSARRHGIPLETIDISADAGLERRYGREIPILVVDGVTAHRGASASEIDALFRRAAAKRAPRAGAGLAGAVAAAARFFRRGPGGGAP